MAATLDYNLVLSETSSDVLKRKNEVSFFLEKLSFFKRLGTILLSLRQKALSKTFSHQLMMSHWLFADVQKNIDTLAGLDLAKLIRLIERLITVNIEIQTQIEARLLDSVDDQNELRAYNNELQETIDNLYSCQRLFLKATKRTVHAETSNEALSSAARSSHTLNTLYARN